MVDCLYMFLAMLLQIAQPCDDKVQQLACYEYTHATWYNPGVFQRVVYNRLAGKTQYGLPPYVDHNRLAGYVARPWVNELGDIVLIEFNGGVYGPVLVADHAAPTATENHGWSSDYARSVSLNIRAEVNYELAAQMGITQLPAQKTNVRIFRFHRSVNDQLREALHAYQPICPKLPSE
jgi:hypothetical protein